MRNENHFKKGIRRRMTATVLAVFMLGAFPVMSPGMKAANTITGNAASKEFVYDGSNIAKFKGQRTVTISKNVSEKALKSMAKVYKKSAAKFAKVKTVKFGDKVTEASSNTLQYFPNVTKIQFGKKVADADGLETFTKLKNITVAKGNENYCAEKGVLYNKEKTKLQCWPQANPSKNAVFPDSVKSIDVNRLSDSIESITLPKSLTDFYSDGETEDVNKESRRYPLNALPKLKEVKVADGNTKFSVEDNVLYNRKKSVCYGIPKKTKVTGIRFSDALKKADASLLYGHTTITDITFGKEFKDESFGSTYFFNGDDTLVSLKSIAVSEENSNYKTVDGVLYSKDMTKLLGYPMARADAEYVIPDSVNEIVNSAFGTKNKNLKKVTLGAAVKESYGMKLPQLQEYAVNEENDSFTARDGVLYNKDMTHLCGYPNDKKDTEYVIPAKIKDLNYYTYISNRNLKTLIIQSDVFSKVYHYDCWMLNDHLPKLEQIKTKGDAPYKVIDGVLLNKEETTLYWYPANKPSTTYSIPDTVKWIGFGAMQSVQNIQTLKLGKKVTELFTRDNFIQADNLKKITLAKGNKNFRLKSGVLYNKEITSLILYPRAKKDALYMLPKTVKSIECANASFYKNKHLKKLEVEKGSKRYCAAKKSIVRKWDGEPELSLTLDLAY